MKNVLILGSTGSIGRNTVDIIEKNKKDFHVIGITGNSNYQLIIKQARFLRPDFIVITEKKYEEIIKKNIPGKIKVFSGEGALIESVCNKKIDLVVCAISGHSGIMPTFQAILNGKNIALANKEVVVSCGDLLMKTAEKKGVSVFPVDSEHSAIFQCLKNEKKELIKKIIITASGGPFFNRQLEKMHEITPEEALNHPTWKMGKKVTIDSATLLNKGMEIIEAHYLFNIPFEKIEVIIHRQSIIHSMVEFIDGSIIAQMSASDMRIPILYALYYPERKINNISPDLKLSEIKNLTFDKPDYNKFPSLKLAYDVGKKGKSYPAVFSSANEVCVNNFLSGKIKFTDIVNIIKKVITVHEPIEIKTIEDVINIINWSKNKTENIIK